jgi:hypothetical protein
MGWVRLRVEKSTSQVFGSDGLPEAYAKPSLKKYRPIAARNEVRNVLSGLL